MEYIFPAVIILGILFFLLRRYRLAPAKKRLTRAAQNDELMRVLLGLDDDSREQLFKLYRDEFGGSAARYARQTYLKWKEGSVRPNKQTFRRFLVHLPRVMSFDLKCEVLRELRDAYCASDNYKLTVNTDDWRETLTPLVESILQKANTAELPDYLQKRLTWLAEDDVQIAEKLLAHSQTQQSLNALKLLENEFANIEYLLDNAKGSRKVTHSLKLPLGTITLNIKRR